MKRKNLLLLLVIYIAFISLGLPDSLLGSGWPAMYRALEVPLHYAGILSMIIAAGTVISSLFSERIISRYGIPWVTTASVLMTALALLGFSISSPTFGIWGASYLVKVRGFATDSGAAMTSLFYGGITVGRLIAGFLAGILNNKQLIWLGYALIFAGLLSISLPFRPQKDFSYPACSL
ncbi:MAG: hypothetical protein WC589_13740 [Sphingobacterium sp.]